MIMNNFVSLNFIQRMMPHLDVEEAPMSLLEMGKSGIKIKKKNRGKFTEYCGGKVTDECIQRGKNSSDPKIRKRATFAKNARAWKHQYGGSLQQIAQDQMPFDLSKYFVSYNALDSSSYYDKINKLKNNNLNSDVISIPESSSTQSKNYNSQSVNHTEDLMQKIVGYSQSSKQQPIIESEDEVDNIISNAENNASDFVSTSVSQKISEKVNNKQDKKETKQPLNIDTNNLNNSINKYLGIPYKYGWDSTSGIDCSAFVRRVMHDMGYNDVKGNSITMYNDSDKINYNDAKPGDLIFLKGTNPKRDKNLPSHVAIIIENQGNGKIKVAEAIRSKGTSINIWDLNDPKYKNKYLSCGRIKSNKQSTSSRQFKFGQQFEFNQQLYPLYYQKLLNEGMSKDKAKKVATLITAQDSFESGYGTSSRSSRGNYGGYMTDKDYGSMDEWTTFKLDEFKKKWPGVFNANSAEDFYKAITTDNGYGIYTTGGNTYLSRLKGVLPRVSRNIERLNIT